MDVETISKEIKNYIRQNITASDVAIDASTPLDDAGIDSFSIVEIILFIEQQYGVVIPDEQLVPENFRTIEALSTTVMALMK